MRTFMGKKGNKLRKRNKKRNKAKEANKGFTKSYPMPGDVTSGVIRHSENTIAIAKNKEVEKC